MSRTLGRWAAALVAVSCGWAAGFLAYLAIANGSPGDQRFWAVWTGGFCFAAWLVVGLPLAVWAPDLSNLSRSLAAVLAVGCIGVLMVLAFFGGTNLYFGLLAFLTAAASMLIYVLLLRVPVLRNRNSASHAG